MTDGLKGMPKALSDEFPSTTLQTCIVHLICDILDYAAWDKPREHTKTHKPTHQAVICTAAEQALYAFKDGAWGKQCPPGVATW